ncbi:Cobalt-precorrin-5B C(1)-methyltransferase [Candidatus Entotheonellaceae bacterium PAL068K]
MPARPTSGKANTAPLRSGYTTGACATAAARGAVLALLYQRRFARARIRLPIGRSVTFQLHTCAYTPDEGRCSVIKDAGDDPDVTHLAEICARATWHEQPGVHIARGPGVGLVTKPGLPVPPGEPAINPVPRQMLTTTVEAILARTQNPQLGVRVEISVPHGEALAKKTFNPRLGIMGGISILGTTGIVVPYSLAAWEASVTQHIDVAAAQGCEHLVFVVGGRGERHAQRLFTLPEIAFVQIADFFGQAFRHAVTAGVQHVTLAAMIGKLSKFAAGNESVHSQKSSQDFPFLARLARQAGAGARLQAQIRHANTAQAVSELVLQAGLTTFHNLICGAAWQVATSLTHRAYRIDVLLVDKSGEIMGRYPSAADG